MYSARSVYAAAALMIMGGINAAAQTPSCGEDRRFTRPVDVWYGTVTVKTAANAILATPSFAHLDKTITAGIQNIIEFDATIDQRVKDDLDRWVFPPGLTNIEWVLDTTGGTDARLGLLSDYGTAGATFGAGTLVPGATVDGPTREYLLDSFVTLEDGGACERQNLFLAMVTYHNLDAVYTLSTTAGKCPLGHGYWKNNLPYWPVSSLMLGALTYSQAELLAILSVSTSKDASIILGRQLIAAKLNVLYGSDPAQIAAAIGQADALLGAYHIPFGVSSSSATGQSMTGLAQLLDDYNNRLLTPLCVP